MTDQLSIQHELFLNMALEQAKIRQGFCAPNPSVGAVAVLDGKIIAHAHHYKAGDDHAEAALIKRLPKDLKEVTLYVTLEPCNHWGKTPPCINAIIDYGIKKVVYAYRDPHIHTSVDKTQIILQEHGIDVIHYPTHEINAFYQSYAFWVTHRLPFITAKWAQSFDAKVAYPGKRVFLSNSKVFEFTHLRRRLSDLILTSYQTILVDNPRLNARLSKDCYDKPIAIIDSQLNLTGNERIFESTENIHIFHEIGLIPKWKKSRVHFHPVGVGLDLKHVIKILGELGYHDVWLEAGPRLMASMHQQRLVQKTHIILTPKLLGALGLNAFSGEYPYFNQVSSFHSEQLDDNILTTFIWQNDKCLQD